ncbi:unnamed protein product, partial [Amoebophrya sp. A120]|eukprot:GSA120T00025938001.1
MLACEINGLTLRYATPQLRNDADLVRVAVAADWRSLRFASGHIRSSLTYEDIALCAIRQNGWAYNPRLRSDRGLVKEAVAQNHDSFLFAGDELRRDPEFVVELMEQGCA